MRGKPFYTLQSKAEGTNSVRTTSVPLCASASHYLLDYLEVTDAGMVLVIRDQKTSPTSGSYRCAVHESIVPLLEKWIGPWRCSLMEGKGMEHTYVFFDVKTAEPFTEPGFSRVVKNAFKRITGENMGLQAIRRVFATGCPERIPLSSRLSNLCVRRLPGGSHLPDGTKLASDGHAHQRALSPQHLRPGWFPKAELCKGMSRGTCIVIDSPALTSVERIHRVKAM